MGATGSAAPFEDFLRAPERIAACNGEGAKASVRRGVSLVGSVPSAPLAQAPVPPRKEKVGLTLDPALVEAVDDYIYQERKKGRRLKKNQVYEEALRRFLRVEQRGQR